jgi:hypothetical protein
MSLVLKDRVLETCTSPGTGTVTLLGAVTGYQSFSTVGNGNTCYYAIADQNGANFEVGIGTYSSAGTLARTTVLSSSNSGNLVNFSTGSQNIFLTYPSSRSVNLSSAALTSGRVTFATTDGLLTDSSKLTFDTSNLTVGVIGLTANADGATGKLVLRKPNEAVGNNQITRMLDFAPYYPGFDEAVVKASIFSGVDTGTQNGQIGFMTATGGVLSEKMRLLANGNLGIGTSSPSSLLQVGTGAAASTVQAQFLGGVTVFENSGATTLVPTITFNNDLDTGINSPAANTIGFYTAGSERMRIDSSGNLSVNSSAGTKYVQLQPDGSIRSVHSNGGGGDSIFSAITGISNGYQISVTTGNAQTYKWHNGGTQSMTLDSNGNLGIGATTVAGKLHVMKTATGGSPQNAAGNQIVMENGDSSGSADLQFLSANNGYNHIFFGDAADANIGTLLYDHNSNSMQFVTNTAERMRIDSSGAVGIGNTNAASFTTFSPKLVVGSGSGGQRITIYSGAGQEGDLIFADGTTGNEQYRGTVRYDHADDAMKFYTNGGINAMIINSAQGVQVLNTVGVGNATPSTSGAGITFPATQSASSNANTLDDYEEGTWTPVFTAVTAPTGVAYGTQVARYTKIGKSVTVWGVVALNSKGTGGSGEVRITGLPFISENVSGLFSRGAGDIGDATWTASRTQITFSTVPNDTYIAIIESGSGQSLSNPTWANQNNNSAYTFTITYPTST